MADELVLTENEALELLSYLVCAARTQVDEAAEYAPMRLLTAAQRLGAALAPRAGAATREFAEGPLAAWPVLAVPRDAGHPADRADRAEYVARLDELCRALATHLTHHFGQEGS
jgi:hypothetical protein